LLSGFFHGVHDSLVSGLELNTDFFGGWDWSLHPFVISDFGHSRSVRWIQLKHTLDQIFEIFREIALSSLFALAMCPPEYISSVGSEASIKGVLRLGSGERRVLSNHDEKNDS